MVEPSRADRPLRLTDSTAMAKVLVRAQPSGSLAASLGVPLGRARRDVAGALVVAGLMPGSWLLLAPPDTGAELVRRVGAIDGAGEFASVIEVSHGHALIRLTGADADAVLAKLCPIDLADAATPDGTVFRSLAAGLTTTVIRDDVGGQRSYLMLCDRSCGQYFVDVLLDAGAEFGIEIDAFLASPQAGLPT